MRANENMSTGDRYRTVIVKLRSIRPSSLMVDNPHGTGWLSIPRSLIHYSDDRTLDDLGNLANAFDYIELEDGTIVDTQEYPLRLMEWKAEQLGLAG